MAKSRWVVLGAGCMMLVSWFVSAVSPPLFAQIDLVSHRVSLAPSARVDQGTSVFVFATVRNAGTTTVETFDATFSWRRTDKEELCGFREVQHPGLSPGSEAILDAEIDTADLTPGIYEIVVWLDPENRLAEGDESNNRISTSLEILPPRPELHPVRLNFDPTSPVQFGETVRVITALENTGASAAGRTTVSFRLLPLLCKDRETGVLYGVIPSLTDTGKPWFEFIPKSTEWSDPLAGLAEAAWIPFASILVPGLEQDEILMLEEVLDTTDSLRGLLVLYLNGNNPQGSEQDLDVDQLEALTRLVTHKTTYAVRVAIGEPVGVQETDPNNNDIIGLVTITPSNLALSELRPVRIAFNRDLPLEWRGTLRTMATVMNVGGSTAEDVHVLFFLRKAGEESDDWGDPAHAEIVPSLGVEEGANTVTIEKTFSYPRFFDTPGSYELMVLVDPPSYEDVGPGETEGTWQYGDPPVGVNAIAHPRGRILEQNDNNNEMVVGLTVKGSELHPQSIELGSAPVRQGDTITVVSQIENTGEKVAESFTVAFYIDTARFDTFYYRGEGLRDDEHVKAQGILDTSDLPPATYYLRVVVDPDDRIPELDEANNVITMPLVVLSPEPRLAELHLTELYTDPPPPIPLDQPFDVEAAIWNSGNIAAERFQVRFCYREKTAVSGPAMPSPPWQIFFSQEVASLSRGEKRTITGNLNPAGFNPGVTYEIGVFVDANAQVDEKDEQNNAMKICFTLGPPSEEWAQLDKPNLVFAHLTATPPYMAGTGIPLLICGAVANTGRADAGPFRVDLFWMDAGRKAVKFASRQFDGLTAGRSESLACETLDMTVLPGTYTIKGVLDPENTVEEQNENDNEQTATVMVISGENIKPDLAPLSVRFAPASSVRKGDPLSVYVTVRNAGVLAASPFDVAYELQGVTTGVETVSGLGPMVEIELWRSIETSAAGTYVVAIVLDSNDRVEESNEENNTITAQFTVEEILPARVEPVLKTGGAVRFLGMDDKRGAIYAASDDGRLHAIARGDPPTELFNVVVEGGSAITAFIIDTGIAQTAYLGTAAGAVYAVGLDSGRLIAEAKGLAGRISALALDNVGNMYVGTNEGIVRLDRGLGVAARADIGEVTKIAVDNARDTLYAITPTGLHALTLDGTKRGERTNLLGTPSALMLDISGVYVGTDAGTFYGFDFYNPYSGIRQKTAVFVEGTITAIVSDPARDPASDPIYATSSDGRLYAFDLSGNLQWTFPSPDEERVGAIWSGPAIDPQTGIVLFGDDAGNPYALRPDGTIAFSVDVDASALGAIRSTPVIDTVIVRDDMGVRQVRTYFYGADDGMIYMIRIDR